MSRKIQSYVVTYLAALSVLAACGEPSTEPRRSPLGGGGNPEGAPPPQPAAPTVQGEPGPEYVTNPPRPIAVESIGGCADDNDCAEGLFCFLDTCSYHCQTNADCTAGASCDSRGRCSNRAENAFGDVGFTDQTSDVPVPEDNKTAINFKVELTGTPTSPIPYLLLRDDEPLSLSQQKVVWGLSQQSNTISVAKNAADPKQGDAARSVNVTVVTPLGRAHYILRPVRTPGTGRYLGEIKSGSFGKFGPALEFDVVVVPANPGRKVWLRLPVGAQYVFSPKGNDGVDGTYITRQLTYDSSLRVWVGAFEYAFQLPPNSPWAAQNLKVHRSLRVEINNDSLTRETLSGTLVDRWNGLYRRFVNGLEEDARVEYTGTFEVRRSESAVDTANLVATPIDPIPALPAMTSPIDRCTDSMFAALGCSGIGSASAFGLANASAQATCAQAAVKRVMESSVSRQLTAFLGQDCAGSSCASTSFKEFVDRCKDADDTLCASRPEAICARQLAARATLNASQDDYASLMALYGEVTREVAFNHQMRAFGRDNDLRLAWLRSTDFPGFVASAARDYTKGLLAEWDQGVVAEHLAALELQFDSSALAILGRIPANAPPEVEDARRRVVSDMTQTWQGAIDSMVTSVNRWHAVLDGTVERKAKADEVTARVRFLYLYAGIVATINRYANDQMRNASLGAAFSTLMPAVERLGNSQDALIYGRDAEVVLSTSLDPTSGQDSVLRLRRQTALEALALAEQSITQVLERADAEALSEQQLFARLDNEVDGVRRQLLEMCGVPAGCDLFDLENPACRVEARAGRCGLKSLGDGRFVVNDAGDDGSEAARALMRIEDAKYGVALAEDELNTNLQRSELMLAEIKAFKQDIEDWNTIRQDGIVATTEMMNEVLKARRESVNALAQGIAERDAIRRRGIAERVELRNQQREQKVQLGQLTREQFEREKAVRAKMVKRAQANIERWDVVRVSNAETDYSSILSEQRLRAQARAAEFGQALVQDIASAAAAAVPTGPTDAGAGARGAALGVAAAEKAILRGAQEAALIGADACAAARERNQELASARLVNMQEQAQVDDTLDQNELEDIRAEIAIDREERQLDIDDLVDAAQKSLEDEALALAASEGRTQLTQAQLELYIGKLQNVEARRQLQEDAEISYKRDLATLREKRQQMLESLLHNAGLDLRIERARLNVLQAMADYAGVVLRSRQADAYLESLISQRARAKELVGSPSVVFRRSNALTRAEASLEHAKSELMDWLVALEYYAVRPFMDHRIAILFSTSPNQLHHVAAELTRIEEDCGGVVNNARATVSLRNTLLGLSMYSVDSVNESVLTPAERLRRLLRDSEPPGRITARYRTDATVGDLFSRRDEVLAATFNVDLGDFANLPAVCNAKLASIAIKLIGDLGSGVAPTVSLLYDGTGTLKSCQADIHQVVSNFGGSTAFGELTRLRTAPRVISPVAGVNTFPGEAQRSRTLEGLPLASQYTVLIDTALGENRDVRWEELQDIELSIDYTFQDVFVESACY